MAKRALGALFALAAGVAFVVAIVTSAWWSGHPVVDGRPISAKDVHVGLLGAEGCNTGGDGSCEAVQVGGLFKVASYAELAATGLAALLAVLLAIAAWRIADNRKGLARATLITTLLAGAGGGLVLALGPAIKASSKVDVPIGWGFFVFIGAIVSSVLASTIARGIEPEPLRLKTSNAPPLPPAPPDIRQMIASDGLRPTALGPEPMLGGQPAPRESGPLFNAAPQLRPLYDPQNAGYAPPPAAPNLPSRAPTPMPRDQIEALTGHPARINPLAAPPPPRHELDWSAPQTPSPQVDTRSQPNSGARNPFGESPPEPSPLARNPYGDSSSRNEPPPRSRAPSSSPLGRNPYADSSAPPRNPFGDSSSRNAVPPSMEPSRSKPMTAPPPSPMDSSRSKPVTAPPPSPMDSSRSKPMTAPPPPPGAPRVAPMGSQPGSSSSSRNAAPMGSQPGSSSSSRNAAPSVPPPGPSSSSSRNAAQPGSSSSSRNAAPSVPPPVRPMVPAPDRTKAPSIPPPPRGKPPTAAPPPIAAPPITAPPARASTIANAGAPPASERNSAASIAKPSGPSASRQPTLAVAVPPMPRASTDTEDHHTAVEIDHEAKARAKHAQSHRPSTEDIRTGGNRTVGDVTDTGINAEAQSPPTETYDAAASPPTDAYEAAESTDVGAALKSFDANATMEQSPPPPSRASATPLPTLARAPSTASVDTPPPKSVPLSTAPSTLPPPKALDPVPSGPTPACPQCESPMAWVDEHLRFYCRSCRMYF